MTDKLKKAIKHELRCGKSVSEICGIVESFSEQASVDQERFERVREIIKDVTAVEDDEIYAEADLIRDMGMESVDFLNLNFKLEKEFGIASITNSDFEQVTGKELHEGLNVSQVIEVVESKLDF